MREIDNMTGEQLETLKLKGMLPERRVAAIAQSVVDEAKDGLDRSAWREREVKAWKMEERNEISNLRHDYEIVSIERNHLLAHIEQLAEIVREVAHAHMKEDGLSDRAAAVLAAWEGKK